MRISVDVAVDDTTKWVYCFNCFDFNIVFVEFLIQHREKGKRKWNTTKWWNNYNERDSTIKTAPELPLTVRADAFNQLQKFIKVYTWNEWKERK